MAEMSNIQKITLIILIFLTLLTLARFPYFNLVFKPRLIAFSCLALTIFMFPIKAEWLFKTCFFFFIFALVFSLAGAVRFASLIGEIIYGLMFLGIIKALVKFFREEK